MATTVTYKNNTLVTVSNQTKTLKTAGKYLEDDITLVDVSGGTEAISIVDTADAAGGTVRTITAVDISDTTAVAGDVAQGKYFYTADGTKTAGTASGGGGSGGDSVSPKQVNFIDYDGTVLYAYSAAEANALSELPANPSHSGLTAQGWNWTLQQIKAQLTAMPDGDVWVGQMYITQSGDTEIDCTFDNPDYLSPYLTIAINGSISVDWGDNTSPSTSTGTSLSSIKYIGHSYTSIGKYTISIHVNNGTFGFYNNTNVKVSVLSTYGYDSNRRYSRVYASCINAIRLGASANIGNYAFQNCSELQSITIPASVTSINTQAFYNCYALQSVTTPSSVTSLGASTFYNCYALQNVSIPNNVTSINNSMFSSCYSLQGVTIPADVTHIGSYAFSGCYALQNVSIPNNVTSIEASAFANCYILQSITIPASVTSIGNNAFQYCYGLQSIIIPDGVTNINMYAFANCFGLQSIIIPNNVTSIGNSAFQNCYTLQSITIPASVTSIGNNAFQNCYSMEEYHIKPTSVPTGGTNMFSGIVTGTVIYVPTESLEAYQTATNWSTYTNYMQGE